MTTEKVSPELTPEGTWHDVDPVDVPDEGRVRSVTVDGRTVALSRCHGSLGALENRCPHQGGPLGEGSIEKGLLRCPWHGYDYDPLTGQPPGDFADSVPVLRRRGAGGRRPCPPAGAGRGGPDRRRRPRRDPGRAWRHPGLRDGRALQPRLRRRAAPGRGARRAALHRHPPRGRRRVRGQRLRQAHRPSGRLLRDRRARLDQPADRPVRRQARPVPRHRRSRARCPPRCSGAAPSRTSTCPRCSRTSRSPRPRCSRAATTPSSPPSPSSTHATAEASPTSSCPTRCRPSRRTPRRRRRPVATPTGWCGPTSWPWTGPRSSSSTPSGRCSSSGTVHAARGQRSPSWPSGCTRRCSRRSRPRGSSRTPTRWAPASSDAAARRSPAG